MIGILLCIISMLLSGGGSEIFKLDEGIRQEEIIDLLSLEKLDIKADRFELNRIIKGDFLPDVGDEFLLIETATSFDSKTESQFKVSFARLSGSEFRIVSKISLFKGSPINAVKGKLSLQEQESVIIHWKTSDGEEYINEINPDGGLKTDIFEGRIVPGTKKEEVALADMNGDGLDEIVIISLRSEKASETDIEKIIVYMTLSDELVTESYAILPARVLDIEVMDIDSDGRDEIITLRETQVEEANQSIWAIKRNDDGVYDEIPIVAGKQLALTPINPASEKFFYFTTATSSGHFYRWINTLAWENNDYQKINEFRLLPEGLILGMVWGRFSSDNESSLAIFMDETLAKRRWLTIYTPFSGSKFLNKLSLFTAEYFRPKGFAPIAWDIDTDNLDEIIFVSDDGKAMAYDPQTQTLTSINIKNP